VIFGSRNLSRICRKRETGGRVESTKVGWNSAPGTGELSAAAYFFGAVYFGSRNLSRICRKRETGARVESTKVKWYSGSGTGGLPVGVASTLVSTLVSLVGIKVEIRN
jgi:hypothetical protein